MKKRLLATVLVAAMSVSILTGCNNNSSENSNTSSGSETVSLSNDSLEVKEANPTGQELKVALLGKDIKIACVIIADKMGFFEEEGANVTFETVASLPEAATAVSEGKLDILPFGAIPSASFISQGADLEVFGGTISEGSEALVLPENKDSYKTAEDFKGKKIGCFRMETGHMIMKGYLREQGLKIDEDVEFVYLDSQNTIMEAVKKGEVDLGFANSGFGYVAKQAGLEVAFQVGDFVSDFPCCRQTTSGASFDSKYEDLVAFEVALLRAYEVYLNDHDTAIEKLVEYSGQDEEYVKNVMYGSDDYDNAMIISLDPNKNKMSDFYDVMKANGDISEDTEYDINEKIDTSIYERAVKILIKRGENKDVYEKLLEEFLSNN